MATPSGQPACRPGARPRRVDAQYAEQQLRAHLAASETLKTRPALIIWPENSITQYLESPVVGIIVGSGRNVQISDVPGTRDVVAARPPKRGYGAGHPCAVAFVIFQTCP